jgi:hypothetical protein
MIEVFDVEQNSPDWYALRAGLVTASEFHKVLAKGQGLTRAQYMRQLAAERLTGEPGERFTSAAMERGHLMEGEARDYYALMRDVDPQLVGFVRNGPVGCSPDAFVGDGLLEIKTKRGDLLIETLLRDGFPPEHTPQRQGALWVCEREWVDLICYWPGMPACIRRAYRDEPYIRSLAAEVERFEGELLAMVERLRRIAA